MIVRLVTTDEDEETRKAILVLKKLSNIEIQISYCPQFVKEWYKCPFMRCGDEQTYFGLDGIKFFVSEQMSI